MELLGVGAAEAFVVLVIALIVVGPQRFPEIARQGGRYFRMARRYAAEVTSDVRGAMAELEAEVEQQKEELQAAHEEIATGLSTSIAETRSEIENIGREAGDAVRDAPAAQTQPREDRAGSRRQRRESSRRRQRVACAPRASCPPATPRAANPPWLPP